MRCVLSGNQQRVCARGRWGEGEGDDEENDDGESLHAAVANG